MKKVISALLTTAILLTGCSQSSSTSNSNSTNSQTQGNYDMETKEITFNSNGNNIYGVARLPKKDGKVPVVIFSHGFGGNRNQEQTLQETLVSRGIAVYSFDFAGGTGFSPGRSEGDMKNMSIFTEKVDLENAIETVKKQDFADSEKIYLLGASQGGVVSSLVANDHSDDIKGLFLIYPAFSLADDARERFSSVSAIPETYNLMGLTVGRTYFERVLDFNIFDNIKNYNGHVEIFHGDKDSTVPYSYSERAKSAFKDANLTQMKGAGHSFGRGEQVEVGGKIADEILK